MSHKRPSASVELPKKMQLLIDLVIPHLNEEEDVLLPILKAHMTEQEMDDLTQVIVNEFSPVELLFELAIISSFIEKWCVKPACDAAFVIQHLESKVPPPVLFLGRWISIPRFLDALESLKGVESGVNKPYSRLPRLHELPLILAVLLVVYGIIRLFTKCCCKSGGKNKKE